MWGMTARKMFTADFRFRLIILSQVASSVSGIGCPPANPPITWTRASMHWNRRMTQSASFCVGLAVGKIRCDRGKARIREVGIGDGA
jgi:hypothetical protein